MGYKAAVQVLKQADDLKAKVCKKSDWLNDGTAWTDQQKLQTIYHQVLVLDLEYALDKKVEQDLWNIGFKNHISCLQELARDKNNTHRADCQALLTWALESASGFYLTLLQELCNTFDIDLPFRRRGSIYGQINQIPEQVDLPQTSSCLYICQYCLVHLGDIARYRNQRKQAESFYKQAILVSPTSGHPYNQLALLEASQGHKLSTVFYYIRGIAVKNPFPASVTNLLSTLSSAIDKDSPAEKIPTKMTVTEFIQLFLCTHGYFHTVTEIKQAELAVKSLNSIMTALVATQSFTKDMLIKMTIINLYALKHLESSPNKIEELTKDERRVRELVLELIGGSISAFLVPVHTLSMDDTLLDYYALPAVKFLLYFIQNEPDVLKENVFTNRLQIWPGLVKLLNNVQKYLKLLNYNKYTKSPLPEDKQLQGFIPFWKNFKDFDFKDDCIDPKIERLIRIKRILNLSIWLTEMDVNGNKVIIKNETNGEIVFEPGSVQPDPTNELLEEMKSFNVTDSPDTDKQKSFEKKGGILKPQGSLEKSREERELLSHSNSVEAKVNITIPTATNNKSDSMKSKRGKQNVALQSIFKKMEENKQVKFSVDESELDKSVKFDSSPPQQKPQQPPQNQQPFNLPLRTQSFNQNHPAFPIPPPAQPDFLTNLRNVPNVPLDKGNNYQFPKNDNLPQNMPNIGLSIMPPYPNIPHPPNMGHNVPQKPPGAFPPQQNSFGNPSAAPYQNMPYSSSRAFNNWKRDEQPPFPSPSWWQNTSQPPPPSQNFPQDNYMMNFPTFTNNMPSFLQPSNPIMQNQDFNKPTTSQGTGDVYRSPWSSYSGGYLNEAGGMTGDSSARGLSIRQAMLKEGNFQGAPVGPPGNNMGRIPNPSQESKFLQNPASTPGYSLFNANSWTPNLAGQLRTTNKPTDNATNHVPQQSLFSGHGPRSLAQLLEQQQSQLNKNDL